jgi:hypothetical protein
MVNGFPAPQEFTCTGGGCAAVSIGSRQRKKVKRKQVFIIHLFVALTQKRRVKNLLAVQHTVKNALSRVTYPICRGTTTSPAK